MGYQSTDANYPSIKMVIANGSNNKDMIIKVSDEGDSIPCSNVKRSWSYMSLTWGHSCYNLILTGRDTLEGRQTFFKVLCRP